MTVCVSVIIPYYNRSSTIKRAIDSVLQKENRLFVGEVIVVDDGSSSVESEKLYDYISFVSAIVDNNKINFVINKYDKNKNAAFARNVGIGCAKYDVVAFLDSDDAWIDGKLGEQIAQLRKNSIVFTQYSKVNPLKIDEKCVFPVAFSQSNIGEYLLKGEGHIQTSTMVMFKQTAEKVLFNPMLRKYQDWDFSIRAWGAGVDFIFIQKPLVNYFVDSDNRIGNTANLILIEQFLVSIDSFVGEDTKRFFLTSSSLWVAIEDRRYLAVLLRLFRVKTFKAISFRRTINIFIHMLKVILLRLLK
jgi:glycosyltransferase involved in cell wall biosynthesis